MRQRLFNFYLVFFISIAICCNTQGPYISHEKTLSGYVIGREFCHLDSEKDYWMIDFTYNNNQPLVGDTITIGREFYQNVLKIKGLRPQIQQSGLPVAIDYKVISESPIVSVDCNHAGSKVYALKEIFAIRQAELR